MTCYDIQYFKILRSAFHNETSSRHAHSHHSSTIILVNPVDDNIFSVAAQQAIGHAKNHTWKALNVGPVVSRGHDTNKRGFNEGYDDVESRYVLPRPE